jgi:transposase
MDTIGLDLHKRESQLCILEDDGRVSERRIVTSRERFSVVLGNRPKARILIEASTESEWVAQHLESLGHEAPTSYRLSDELRAPLPPVVLAL